MAAGNLFENTLELLELVGTEIMLLGDLQGEVHLAWAVVDVIVVYNADDFLQNRELEPTEAYKRVTEMDGPQFKIEGCEHHFVGPETGQTNVIKGSIFVFKESRIKNCEKTNKAQSRINIIEHFKEEHGLLWLSLF